MKGHNVVLCRVIDLNSRVLLLNTQIGKIKTLVQISFIIGVHFFYSSVLPLKYNNYKLFQRNDAVELSGLEVTAVSLQHFFCALTKLFDWFSKVMSNQPNSHFDRLSS